MQIIVESPIHESPRVAQVRGAFDLEPEKASRLEWNLELPIENFSWNVGLIVGPSGCGKSTITRHVFGRPKSFIWPGDRSILDGFPEELSIKSIIELLSSVGFSSPPAWLRPFHVLSTGQQFRVTLARLLASTDENVPAVMDEFTSTVDRTVAKIGSTALAKTVRRRKLKFVAVTCHEDVEEWLQPDWIYRPAEALFTRRCLQPRPKIDLNIVRCQASAWPLFAPHHYLSGSLARSAVCFLTSWQDQPVAFSAWLPFVGRGPKTRREHRTVTLPDYQGVGIGNVLSATIASLWKAMGYRAISTTTHPAMIRSRLRSPLWRMRRRPSLASRRADVFAHASTRLTAGFEYVGPPMSKSIAQTLLRL